MEVKMNKLLSETETTILKSEDAAILFFEALSKHSVWKRCYTKDLLAVGISPNPIFLNEIRKVAGIHSSVSDESITENMESLALGLRVPVNDHFETYPLGDTAFSTLADRAGFTKNAPAIMTLRRKNGRTPLDEEAKATVLNFGLKTADDRVLVLIRDEKIRATLSGDDKDYKPFEFSELMKVFREELSKDFRDISFHNATVDHSYSTCLYEILDKELMTEIENVFSRNCIDLSGFEPCVRLITSDVGICGINIYPYLCSHDKKVMLGRPITLTHRFGSSMSDFATNVHKCYSLFKETTEKLKKMSDISVRHPLGCIQKVAKACGLNKKITIEEANIFEKMYKGMATMLDVYWELQDIYEKMAPDEMTESRRICLQENITRICFSNLSEYDVPYTWE